MPKKLAILFAYFLIYVVWGATYYFIGVALHGFPTFLLGALRFSTAGLILLVICACRGERVFIPRLVGRSAVSGIILLFIDMAVVMLAQRYVSSSLVAVVASSTAIWIMALDAPMWKYTFRSKCTLAGILMGFAGVGLLYAEQLEMTVTVHDHSEYGILLLVAGCISWALGTLGALRFSTAGLILLVICACRGERVFIPRLVGRSAVSGIILLFIDMAVVMLAQRYVSSSLVAVVASSTAIWIMALDAPMWKYTFRSKCTLAGILMGFAGVGLLYAEQLEMTVTVHDHSEYGILLLVAGCISWALGTLYTKYRSSDTEPANAFAGSAWQMLFAGMMFWICTLGNGEFSPTGFSTVPLYAWLSLAYLILFGSLMAYSAYVWLLKIRPTTEVGTHAYVNPVVAVVIGGGLGGEQITGIQLLGLVIILGSVMLVNKKERINE